MEAQENRNWVRIGITWVHHTLVVIGALAAVTFIRVNFFGHEFSINFPEYSEAAPMKMDSSFKHR